MRNIEEKMLANLGSDWKQANTETNSFGDVFLHGNCISTLADNGERAYSLAGWDTPTTKSRLRALGCPVYTRKGVTYFGDVSVNSDGFYFADGRHAPCS